MISAPGGFGMSPSYTNNGDGTYSPLSISPSTPKKDWEQNYATYLSRNEDKYASSDGSSTDLKIPSMRPSSFVERSPLNMKSLSLNSELDSDESGDGRRRRLQTTDAVIKSNGSVHGGKHFLSLFANKKHSRRMQSTGDLDATIRSGSTVTLTTSSSLDQRQRGERIPQSGLISMGKVIAPRVAMSIPNRRGKRSARKEHKMLFTEMRNQFSTDTGAAYLGEEKSVQRGKSFAELSQHKSFGSLSSVSEHIQVPATTKSQLSCILTPIAGPEAWTENQRYLMLPAILASCPDNVFSLIGGSSPKSVSNDENSTSVFFLANVLGRASVAHVISKGLIDEDYEWFEGTFVVRQNYLLEYDSTDNVNSRPKGYAFLQNATIRSSDRFSNSLRLDYHQNSSSSVPRKSVIIKLDSNDELERWKASLSEAARLKVEDLFEFNYEGKVLGKGRYATIFPGRRRKTKRKIDTENSRHRKTDSNGILKKKPSFTSFSNLGTALSEEEYECAIKIIDKDRFWDRVRKGVERADSIVRETSVQAAMLVDPTFQHGFLQVRSFFETSNQVVLELELLQGFDLYRHVSSKGLLAEVETANIMYDLLNCIKAMQENGVAHRDVKPGNILMADSVRDGVSVKLGDFGMAAFVSDDNLVRGRCGTPGYVAPEILSTNKNEGYRNTVDVFSAGVVMYILLCGYEPFYGENEKQLIQENKTGNVEYPKDDWKDISIEGRDLVEKMLERDPLKRISASKALSHPWITRRVSSRDREKHSIENMDDFSCVIS
jgi:serine/threonine protein kinase